MVDAKSIAKIHQDRLNVIAIMDTGAKGKSAKVSM